MEEFVNWIIANSTWIFSGIGVFIIGLVIYNKSKKKRISQKIGDNSSGIQAGRDVNINEK